MIPRLTDLYIQKNQFDRLLARLQRQENDAGRPPTPQQLRERRICLAGVRLVGRPRLGPFRAGAAARGERPRHTSLLSSSRSSPRRGTSKVRRVIWRAQRPDPERGIRLELAQIYARSRARPGARPAGPRQQATSAKTPASIGSLLGNDKPAAVLEITENLLRATRATGSTLPRGRPQRPEPA
ncbi:MAG: hypothetical protein U0835_19910 [Isosphaeraceae bacterium]